MDGIWGTIDIDNLSSVNPILEYSTLFLYPNVAKSGQKIHFNTNNEAKDVIIYDISGKKVAKTGVNNSSFIVPHIKSGIYFVHLHSDKNITIGRFIVQ